MIYDVAIIGGGPAGLTAGIYSALAGHSTVILEKYMFGGQITISHEVKNYPSFTNIDGTTLAMQMMDQAKACGVELKYEEVIAFKNINAEIKEIETNKNTIQARTIILAMGAKARNLGVSGEEKFISRGVGYCATCDGSLYKDKEMAVVGGGNSAFEDAIYLSSLASKIHLIHYRNTFKANNDLLEQVQKLIESGKIELHTPYKTVKFNGSNVLEGIEIENVETHKKETLNVSALFVAVGRDPEVNTIKNMVETDKFGYILTDENMCTSVKGVFACGDIRQKMLRQVVTACSDGAIASTSAHKYITETKK